MVEFDIENAAANAAHRITVLMFIVVLLVRNPPFRRKKVWTFTYPLFLALWFVKRFQRLGSVFVPAQRRYGKQLPTLGFILLPASPWRKSFALQIANS